jgi:type II secretory pathway predicted ATPase ExeA
VKLLLVGAPRSGKSMVVRRLAESFAGGMVVAEVLVLVDRRSLSSSGCAIAPGVRVVEVTRANRQHLVEGLAAWLDRKI